MQLRLICLTPENIAAPWIHFEAGALSTALNARISAVMLGVNSSDLKGPLTRYQSTVFEREDFFQLFQSINDASETPLKQEILTNAFDNAWKKLEVEFNSIIKQYVASNTVPTEDDSSSDSDAIQEILRLLRKLVNDKSEPPTQTSGVPRSSLKMYKINIILGKASAEDVYPLLRQHVIIPSTGPTFLTDSESIRCRLYISIPELEKLKQDLLSLGVSAIKFNDFWAPA